MFRALSRVLPRQMAAVPRPVHLPTTMKTSSGRVNYFYQESVRRHACHGNTSDVSYFLRNDRTLQNDRVFMKNLMISSLCNPFVLQEVLPFTSQNERDDFAHVIAVVSSRYGASAESLRMFSATLTEPALDVFQKGLRDSIADRLEY